MFNSMDFKNVYYPKQVSKGTMEVQSILGLGFRGHLYSFAVPF